MGFFKRKNKFKSLKGCMNYDCICYNRFGTVIGGGTVYKNKFLKRRMKLNENICLDSY